MTEQEIGQEVEEMLEALKVFGFPPLSEIGDIPKFAFPVCSHVARIKNLPEKVVRRWYCRREYE